MGMFTIGSYTESVELSGSTIVAQECFEDNMHTAALRVVAESESNWNQIMQAVAIQELNAYETTGDADTYVEEAANGFLASVKAFFVKLLEKIKGIFNKFISIVDQWSKSDKDFVKKYRQKVLTANSKDFEFSGYEFTYKSSFGISDSKLTEASGKVSSFAAGKKADYEAISSDYRGDKLSDKLDEYRTIAINEVATTTVNGATDASDFSKELASALRNGETSKVTLDNISPSGELNKIEKTEDIKKAAKKAYTELDKSITTSIKAVEKLSTETSKNLKEDGEAKGAYIRAVGAVADFMRSCQSINTTAYGAYLDAIKAENRQAKAICVKLMSYKVKNESTSYYEEGSSLLGNIRMI